MIGSYGSYWCIFSKSLFLFEIVSCCRNFWDFFKNEFFVNFVLISSSNCKVCTMKVFFDIPRMNKKKSLNYWILNCTLRFDRKIHVYLLPDIRYRPLVSTAKEVTASKCATMTWVCFPVLLSKNRICRSSCAVIVSGSVGWDTTLVMRPKSAPSCNTYQKKSLIHCI